MGLKGDFSWIQCMRQGGRKAISFTLTCNNMLQSETFDAAIIDGSAQLQPMMFRQLNLPAKKSLRFDFDTVGWDWCQGDTFAILDKKGQVDKKWQLNLKAPAPGDCKECHGTHRCRYCNGIGRITNYKTHELSSCQTCYGTGICQTCYVPMRNQQFFDNGYNPMPNLEMNRQRRINDLRMRINELQSKIDKMEWDERMARMKGSNVSSYFLSRSLLQLKYTYQTQIIKLQSELRQLENNF